MFQQNRVKVEICSTEYTIQTPEDRDFVRELAATIDQNLKELMEQDPNLSMNTALVLCSLSYLANAQKAQQASDHMRAQVNDYLKDAARARMETEEYKRELERVRRELDNLRQVQGQ